MLVVSAQRRHHIMIQIVDLMETAPGVIRLRNQFVEAKLNYICEVSSLKILGGSKELVAADKLANVFVMFDDIPLYWDAWDVMDYHLETRRPAVKQVRFD
ncbi:hypothetical protein HPB52_004468 [Rhipicephalus sanguineus]|uniref:Glycosyl hydrolase family 38 C-terminal domain-containing protein n=1 Tax=Rhipicephalus sanguineus TaxID=34632 RepID=A0A9D4SVP9_RHISA|nr:hypothetical protein HPB52_004468 [Rhipicephalus sanguineus]